MFLQKIKAENAIETTRQNTLQCIYLSLLEMGVYIDGMTILVNITRVADHFQFG